MLACYEGVAQAFVNRIENCTRLGLGAARLREAEARDVPGPWAPGTTTGYTLNLTRTYSWAIAMKWLGRAFSTEWTKTRVHLRAACRYARNTFKDLRQDINELWPGEMAPITVQWIWPPGRQLLANLRRFRKERIARIIAEQERVAQCREKKWREVQEFGPPEDWT